jgi:hypothetical protein
MVRLASLDMDQSLHTTINKTLNMFPGKSGLGVRIERVERSESVIGQTVESTKRSCGLIGVDALNVSPNAASATWRIEIAALF